MPAPANFPVTTHAVWTEFLPSDVGTIIQNKANDYAGLGKTDGVAEIPTFEPPVNIYRYWADVPSAQEWMAWVQSLNLPTLVSITIVS